MILRAKYLITGDGRTCLQDQAVYLDKEEKIGWIGDAAEAAGALPGRDGKGLRRGDDPAGTV